jgi:hypothetical protein
MNFANVQYNYLCSLSGNIERCNSKSYLNGVVGPFIKGD